jgi:transcription initiation factor TFIIA large subunit
VKYRAPTPAAATPKPRNDAGDDDEPPLNEDDGDDDELDDLEQGDDEPNTQHLVLAQFDKVTTLSSRYCVPNTSSFSLSRLTSNGLHR